jgi:hypothetical protein
MDKLKRYFTQAAFPEEEVLVPSLWVTVCLSSDVEKLEARVEELEMKGAISPPDENGKRTMCLGFHETENVYEWAEFVPVEQFNALEARVKEMEDDLKSTIESSNEMSDSNGELTAELLALREKYSTPCECDEGVVTVANGDESGGAHFENCQSCDGTGRVMMLEAEGVKGEIQPDIPEAEDWNAALDCVLKGDSQ